MDPQNFMSLIFNSETPDAYYDIRNSILYNCEISDIVNILVATGCRYTHDEFRRCIKYNCISRGITIVSLGTPDWVFPRHKLVNVTYYDNIQESLAEQYSNWLTMVNTANGPVTAMFNATSSNSHFYFSLMASANTYYVSPNRIAIRGHLKFGYTIQSKRQPHRTLTDLWTRQQHEVSDLPIRPRDEELMKLRIRKTIRELCEYMSMDVFKMVEIFRSHMIYEDTVTYGAVHPHDEEYNL